MPDPIEEFLRRATQQRAVPLPSEDDEILDAEIVEDEILEDLTQKGILSGEDVASHVSHHFGGSGFQQRVSQLGEEVDQSDDRMEAHLHGVFEHRLGQLGATTSRAEDSILDDDSPAAGQSDERRGIDIKGLFRTPGNIRDAVILSEIINRPEHRW